LHLIQQVNDDHVPEDKGGTPSSCPSRASTRGRRLFTGRGLPPTRGVQVETIPEEAVPDVLVRLAIAAATSRRVLCQCTDPSSAYVQAQHALEHLPPGRCSVLFLIMVTAVHAKPV
jgi:hypothetical protein